jgi:hypothetical protein
MEVGFLSSFRGTTVAVVSDDDELLERVRRLLGGHTDVEEKPMVGGRGFLVGGRMCCGITRGGLWVRVGRGEVDAALGEPYVSRAAMGGSSLTAFVVVAPHGSRPRLCSRRGCNAE